MLKIAVIVKSSVYPQVLRSWPQLPHVCQLYLDSSAEISYLGIVNRSVGQQWSGLALGDYVRQHYLG